jgi:hypothetical protein
MTNQIQVLADRAKKSVPHGLTPDKWIEVYNQKFAELIVQECIGCCEQVISDPVPESVDTWLNGGSQCISEIRQHFGVEE